MITEKDCEKAKNGTIRVIIKEKMYLGKRTWRI